MNRVKCLLPFTDLIIQRHGYCYSCCPAWTKIGPIGKLSNRNSLMDIWNSPTSVEIRRAMYANELGKICSSKNCAYMMNDSYTDLDTFKTDDRNIAAIIEQMKQKKLKMETPPSVLEVSYSALCNLRCVMCFSNDESFRTDDELDRSIFRNMIPPLLPHISRIRLTGGEALFSKNSREFLREFDSERYPDIRISMITNAMLFTPRMWETIKHNKFDFINVSIDAATKETYEYVRKNGKWEKLMENLRFISNLRKELLLYYFVISFTVMRSNYHEMKDFVRLGHDLGCDLVLFQRILGFINTKENFIFSNDKKIMSEIGQILEDPIFKEKNVDITLLEEFRAYAGQKPSALNKIASSLKQNLFYFPAQGIYKTFRKFPPILDFVQTVINQAKKF